MQTKQNIKKCDTLQPGSQYLSERDAMEYNHKIIDVYIASTCLLAINFPFPEMCKQCVQEEKAKT